MFELQFDTNNYVFDDDAATETAMHLRQAADRIEAGFLDGPIIDINGNRIGQFNLNDA